MAGTLGEGGGRLVDHPTNPLTDSKGWGWGDANAQDTAHLTVDKSYRILSDRVTKTETWTGPQAELIEIAKKYPIGYDSEVAPDLKTICAERVNPEGNPFVTENSMSRAAGNICTLTLGYAQLYAVSQWSLSFNAVEKDIHTWMSDATNTGDRPDIALVRAWEALEPQSDGYRQYTVNGTPLTGNTLELAKMINRGVTSYTLYQPVLTATYTTRHAPLCGENLNHIFEGGEIVDVVDPTTKALNVMQGQPVTGADLTAMLPTEVATPKSNTHHILWVNSSDRLQHNPDGTFTRSVEFTGVTDVDKNLYYSQKSSQGGADEDPGGGLPE